MVVATAVTAVAAATVDVAAPDAGSVTCRSGSKRAIIGGKVKCLRVGQACSARYQAAYRRYGFTCVSGHLRKRTVKPPAPPAPPPPPPAPPAPPPPPAQAGHYKGTTSQLEVLEFDVDASGTVVRNFSTGQINEGCTPAGSLSGGNFTGGATPIAADGSFLLDFDYTGSVSGNPSTGHFTMRGQFSGSTATGTLEKTTKFTYNGVQYSCGSGRQTWTVTRTG
jgi:hypothetical protein